MILSLLYLVLTFGGVHVYWIGEPLESWLSMLATFYLLTCTWAFPYMIKEVGDQIEAALRSPLGFLLWSGIYLFYYLISPFLYLYFKFFNSKN